MKKRKVRPNRRQPLKNTLLETLRQHYPKSFTVRQLAKKINSSRKKAIPSSDIQHALAELLHEGKIERVHRNKYTYRILKKDPRIVQGTVDMIRSGAAYIISPNYARDIFVPAKHLSTALDGDTVEVLITRTPKGRNPQGRVLRVIKRARELYVGVVYRSGKSLFARVSQGMAFEFDIRIVDIPPHLHIEEGYKVALKVIDWKEKSRGIPLGKVEFTLGPAGSHEVEMNAILLQKGFPLEFPPEVYDELQQLSDEIPEEELQQRLDLRHIPTFTIDPDDAKDFDDALSVQHLKGDTYQIGVHIADVSHYVAENSALDREALRRGNSVYLINRVLPMLPERLSNDYCSLRPGKDKRCFSVLFTIDLSGKVHHYTIAKTVIHSDKRFTYSEAQEVLDSRRGKWYPKLSVLHQIAQNLRKKRFQEGSIDFNIDEIQYRLDQNGRILFLGRKERLHTHMLIEDFMLLANRTVAREIQKKSKNKTIPFVYRIHDHPDPEKIQDFALFTRAMGLHLKFDTPKQIVDSFNQLAQITETDERYRFLGPLAIRTMAKAEYHTQNIGHFGLGFEYYTHFTSPIRRYADLVVHRILEKLDRGQTVNPEKLQRICTHISQRERAALEAERESIRYFQVEYIRHHIGEVFDAQISGLIESGIFAVLPETLIEGFIPFDTLPDNFILSEDQHQAYGYFSQRKIKIGDPLRVRVVDADLATRRVEFEWVDYDDYPEEE